MKFVTFNVTLLVDYSNIQKPQICPTFNLLHDLFRLIDVLHFSGPASVTLLLLRSNDRTLALGSCSIITNRHFSSICTQQQASAVVVLTSATHRRQISNVQ